MTDRRRRVMRYVAAAASVGVAIVYFMIGLGVVTVVATPPADGPSMLAFGVPAGSAFVIGAVLLVAFDYRVLWLLGGLLQVGTIVMYFVVAPQREPPFEIWGILIKVGQVVILGALAYLAVHAPVVARAGLPAPQAR